MPELGWTGEQVCDLAQAYRSSSIAKAEDTSVNLAEQDIGTQRLQRNGDVLHLHARILDDEPELSLLQVHFNVNDLEIWFTIQNGRLHNA